MHGRIKINVDAAWNAATSLGRIGIVARDHTGTVCGERQKHMIGGSVDELEADTVVEVMALAVDRGWSRVQVESDSDSETIINHLTGASFTWRIDALLSHARVMKSSLSTVT